MSVRTVHCHMFPVYTQQGPGLVPTIRRVLQWIDQMEELYPDFEVINIALVPRWAWGDPALVVYYHDR